MQVEREVSASSGARVSSAWEPALLWGITEGNLG
jgi:hypothetical protein